MMRSPIEIELRRKVGSPMLAMPLELVIITRNLIQALYVPTIVTLILDPADMKYTTLLISFDYLPELINEFLI
jgi:hypothetical protein